MKKILEELWFGNIYPAEDALKMTPEMKDIGRLIERNREDLMSTLTEHSMLQMLPLYRITSCVTASLLTGRQVILLMTTRLMFSTLSR